MSEKEAVKITEKRNLSGIYFRYKTPEREDSKNDKFENRCFEDLPEEDQDKMMEGRSEEWLKSLAKQLANTLRKIGDEFDIIAK